MYDCYDVLSLGLEETSVQDIESSPKPNLNNALNKYQHIVEHFLHKGESVSLREIIEFPKLLFFTLEKVYSENFFSFPTTLYWFEGGHIRYGLHSYILKIYFVGCYDFFVIMKRNKNKWVCSRFSENVIEEEKYCDFREEFNEKGVYMMIYELIND